MSRNGEEESKKKEKTHEHKINEKKLNFISGENRNGRKMETSRKRSDEKINFPRDKRSAF